MQVAAAPIAMAVTTTVRVAVAATEVPAGATLLAGAARAEQA